MPFNYERAEAWRKHPLLTGGFRHAVPGFFLGGVLFAAYVGAETLLGPKKEKH